MVTRDVPIERRQLSRVRPLRAAGIRGRAGKTIQPRAPLVDSAPKEEPASRSRWPALPVSLFIVSIFIPWIIAIGGIVMSPYRFVLIVFVMPCLFKLLTGRAGEIRLADFGLLFFCFWATISLVVRTGFGAGLQSGGILFVETMGAYLLARCYVRTSTDYYNVILLLFRCILLLAPFVLFEALTGQNVLLSLNHAFMTTHPDVHDTRWGLKRVQSVLEHPILFGVVVGSVFAPAYLVLGHGQSFRRRLFPAGVVGGTAFLSLSSGPITALFVQLSLVVWNGVLWRMKQRWRLLGALALLGYTVIALVSNQSVFEFAMTYFAFSPENAYYRVLIWEFGSASALNHPWFGTGMADWERPAWLPPSIDMFWLYNAIVYGIPPALAILSSFMFTVAQVCLKPLDDVKLLGCRLGYVASMAGLFAVGWTVHFWNVTYIHFLFLFGSGIWLLDAPNGTKKAGGNARRRPSGVRKRAPARRKQAGPQR